MKRKFLINIFFIIYAIALFSQDKKPDEVIWKLYLDNIFPHYIFSIKNEIYCNEIGKGFIKISGETGKQISKDLFYNENDERRYLMDIKVLPDTGVFGVIYYKRKVKDKKDILVDEEQWIVEIKENFKINKVKMNQFNETNSDYIISHDKKRYFFYGFAEQEGSNKSIYYSNWREINSSKIILFLKQRDINSGKNCITYYLDDIFYMYTGLSLIIYNQEGKYKKSVDYEKDYLKIFKTEWIMKGEDFFTYPEISILLSNNLWKNKKLTSFIFGDDGNFYLLLNNINDYKESYKYYILKIDKDLNLIGKRLVELSERFSEYGKMGVKNGVRCVSGIYIDKYGYIFVISDKEQSITKFKPIQKGEESTIFINNREYK